MKILEFNLFILLLVLSGEMVWAVERQVLTYYDGEIREQTLYWDNWATKIYIKKVNDNERIWEEHKVDSKGHKTPVALYYYSLIDPKKFVTERNYIWNRQMILNRYFDEEGVVALEDFYFPLYKNGEIPYRRRLYDKRGKKKDTLTYLFYPNGEVLGMLRERDGEQYRYNISEPPPLPPPVKSDEILTVIIDSGFDLYHDRYINRLYRNPNEIPENGIDDDNNGLIDDISGYDFISDSPHAHEIMMDIEPYTTNDDVRKAALPAFHGTHVGGIIIDNSFSSRLAILIADITLGTHWELINRYIKDTKTEIVNLSSHVGGMESFMGVSMPGSSHVIEGNPKALFVVAAGNDRSNFDKYTHRNFFPVSCLNKNMIVASASTGSTLQDINSPLATDYTSYGIHDVDIVAPGTNVLSGAPGSDSVRHSGTSMAAPMVTAVSSDVKSILISTVSKLRSFRYSKELAGLVKRIILSTVYIPPEPFPVRSGGSIDVTMATKLALLLAQKKPLSVFEGNGFDMAMKALFGTCEYERRVTIWNKNGGLDCH